MGSNLSICIYGELAEVSNVFIKKETKDGRIYFFIHGKARGDFYRGLTVDSRNLIHFHTSSHTKQIPCLIISTIGEVTRFTAVVKLCSILSRLLCGIMLLSAIKHIDNKILIGDQNESVNLWPSGMRCRAYLHFSS